MRELWPFLKLFRRHALGSFETLALELTKDPAMLVFLNGIENRRGLHARASAKFVSLASALPAEIEVAKDGNVVCGTSIMGLMMLGAAKGDTIEIRVAGDGADDALARLIELVEDRFGED